MSNSNLKVDLHSRKDKDGRQFLVGKLKFNGTINCSNGITFLVFMSEEGSEQLQVASMEKDKNDND